jgi:hypothetical protein
MVKRVIGEIAQFYGDKPNSGQYDNGCWQDVLQIPFLQRIEEAGLYKVIIRTLWLESTGWSKEIRNRFPDVIQIGLNDHPLSGHISKLPADKQNAYLSDLQYLDGVMALTEEERQWYQVALPSKPVIHSGLPFPFESYEEKFGGFRGSEQEFVGLGVGAADNDRNFVSSVLAFKKLQLNNPDLKGVFLSVPHQLISQAAYWADQVPNVFVHKRNDMAEYMELLSRCKFIINLADRNTPGRIQGEAAFFKIPVIGSNRLELQNLLYPNLATTPYTLEDVVSISQLMLDEPKLGKTYGEAAYQGLKEWDYRHSKERFNGLLDTIRKRY